MSTLHDELERAKYQSIILKRLEIIDKADSFPRRKKKDIVAECDIPLSTILKKQGQF